MAAELDVEAVPTQIVKAKPHSTSFPFVVGNPSPLLTPQLKPREHEVAQTPLAEELPELFAENVAAKLWKVAVELGDQEVRCYLYFLSLLPYLSYVNSRC